MIENTFKQRHSRIIPQNLRFPLSGVLFKEADKLEKLIYYVSRTLQPIETRYSSIEKLSLALTTVATNFKPYFQVHKIQVFTDQPLKQALK